MKNRRNYHPPITPILYPPVDPANVPDNAWPEATFTHTVGEWDIWYYEFDTGEWMASATHQTTKVRVKLDFWSADAETAEQNMRACLKHFATATSIDHSWN